MGKSFVTMAVCPICRKETGDLLMDTKVRDVFERYTMTPEPCQECREKYLSNGVLIIAPETSRIAVITDDAFLRRFNMDLPPKKIAFCDERVMDWILTPPPTETEGQP